MLTGDLVTMAMRKIGVLAHDEAATSEMVATGLDALNLMLHGWKLRGVDLTHTDLEQGDTFPLADEYNEGVVYNLASRLSPDYGMPASFDADDWFRAIQAAYMVIDAATIPSGIRSLPSQYAPRKSVRW